MPSLKLPAVFLRCALLGTCLLACAWLMPHSARAASPCGKDYPVIVYDASTGNSFLSGQARIQGWIDSPPPGNHIPLDEDGNIPLSWGPAVPEDWGSNIPATWKGLHWNDYALGRAPGFLCDGKPVEVYVVNRKLKSSFTLALTLAFTKPPTTVDLRGLTAPTSTPPAATPAAKGGFAPPVLNTNLLTADQTMQYFLDDETFDKPFIKVADDAAAVEEQFQQFEINATLYTSQVGQLTAPPGELGIPGQPPPAPWMGALPMPGMGPNLVTSETPISGPASITSLAGEWWELERDVDSLQQPAGPPPPTTARLLPAVSEPQFTWLMNRADRLEAEVTRVNTAIQQASAVDDWTNLNASASILRDNIRGVRNEVDSIKRALEILAYASKTLPEQTGKPSAGPASKVAQDYEKEREQVDLRNALRARFPTGSVSDNTLARIVDDYANYANGEWKDLNARKLIDTGLCPAPPERLPGYMDMEIQNRYCDLTTEKLDKDEKGIPGLINEADAAYNALNPAIIVANRAEGQALRAINFLYDNAYGPIVPLSLNLQGNSGNLFVYFTITGSEQFQRYQIVADLAQPTSNCGAANMANTNSTGGINVCTAATSTIPPPQATLSVAQFPPSTVTATAVPASFYGRVEVHHFTEGALVTGIGYDSIPNVSFAWNQCPESPANLTGSTASPTPSTAPCISPTPPTTTPPTPEPTYYQLVSAGQARVAAIEGVNLYLHDRDMFGRGAQDHAPALFLGAAAYPLTHFYVGVSEEPIRGMTITGGFAGGAENVLPKNYGYVAGSTAVVNPTVPSATHLKAGWFFMIGFDTNIFLQIFSNQVFQNVLSVGTAGSSSPPSTPPSK